jgi:hypothetical protein
MIGNHTSLWVVGAFVLQLLAGCDRSRELVELPTRGRVYVERQVGSQKRLEPASGVLILAERINVCERSSWSPGEGSTTGIDAYLVRSDADGRYQIPGRRAENVCSRVVLSATAFVPAYYSLSARVALLSPYTPNKALYAELDESDAVLQPREPGGERARELARELYSAFSSYTVTAEMAQEIRAEMRPEFLQMPVAWPEECKALSVCDD